MANDEAEKILYRDQLDEIPWQDAGRGFPAKLRRRAFSWGRAVIFLTTGYAQGPRGGPVNNEMLTFVVQGITNNGLYSVNGHFSIHHPKLPNSANDKNGNGKRIFDFDKQEKRRPNGSIPSRTIHLSRHFSNTRHFSNRCESIPMPQGRSEPQGLSTVLAA